MNDMQDKEINFMDMLRSLLRRWWIILISTALFACGGFVMENIRYTPSYSTTIKMYVNNDSMMIGPTKVSISSGDIQAAQSLVYTYREILMTYETYEKTMEVIEASGEELSREYSYDAFLAAIDCDALNETEVFYIRVTCVGQKSDKNLPANAEPAAARDACLIADAIQISLIERIENVINSATASKVEGVHRYSTSSCNDMKTGLIAAAIGFILAAGLCVCFDVFINDKLQDEEWLSESFKGDYSMLAVVPNGYQTGIRGYKRYGSRYGKKSDTPSTAEENDGNPITNINYAATEAYNRLRTNIAYSLPAKEDGAHIVAITSASPSEGKTFTATHLAYSLAKEGNRTLLVECDMRRPAVGMALGLKHEAGLSDLLVGKSANVIQEGVIHENMSVVLAGVIPPNPSDLLSSPKMKAWLGEVSRNYEYIILDLPPVLAVADPLIVAKYADAMVVVTKHDSTRKKYIISSIKQLKVTNVRILGFVYNDFRLDGGHYYKNEKYYYAQHYQGGAEETTETDGEGK